MSEQFFKSFQLSNCIVLVMLRGAGDKDDCTKIEMSTCLDGLFISAAIDTPTETADEAFDDFDQETAETFVVAMKEMLGADDGPDFPDGFDAEGFPGGDKRFEKRSDDPEPREFYIDITRGVSSSGNMAIPACEGRIGAECILVREVSEGSDDPESS